MREWIFGILFRIYRLQYDVTFLHLKIKFYHTFHMEDNQCHTFHRDAVVVYTREYQHLVGRSPNHCKFRIFYCGICHIKLAPRLHRKRDFFAFHGFINHFTPFFQHFSNGVAIWRLSVAIPAFFLFLAIISSHACNHLKCA